MLRYLRHSGVKEVFLLCLPPPAVLVIDTGPSTSLHSAKEDVLLRGASSTA